MSCSLKVSKKCAIKIDRVLLWKEQGTKNSRPFLDIEEGTRVYVLLNWPLAHTHPWCHPDCLSCFPDYHGVARVERPLFMVISLHGNHPPVPTCLMSILPYMRLSSVSRFRRRSEEMYPFRPSTLYRIAVGHLSHTMFVQRGSACMNLSGIKHTSKMSNCQTQILDLTRFLSYAIIIS